MLDNRINDHRKTLEDEFDDLIDFLDADIPEPELEVAWKERPHYSNNKITINPLMPKFVTEHETRHAVQDATVQEFAFEFQDELKDFYRSELEDLEPSWSMDGMYYRAKKALTNGSRLKEIKRGENMLNELGPENTGNLISGKNYVTSQQPEVWASDGYLVPNTVANVAMGVYWGDDPSDMVDNFEYFTEASDLWLDTQTNNLELFHPEVSNQEMAVLLGLSAGYLALNAVAYGGAAIQAYETLQPEPLKESSLTHLDSEDRRRAMLYNDEVAEGVDEFLEVLDSYGVE